MIGWISGGVCSLQQLREEVRAPNSIKKLHKHEYIEISEAHWSKKVIIEPFKSLRTLNLH